MPGMLQACTGMHLQSLSHLKLNLTCLMGFPFWIKVGCTCVHILWSPQWRKNQDATEETRAVKQHTLLWLQCTSFTCLCNDTSCRRTRN